MPNFRAIEFEFEFFQFVLLKLSFSTKFQESYSTIKLHSKLQYSGYESTETFLFDFLCGARGKEQITKS